MENYFYVYKITNLLNGKIYIGKSRRKLKCGATRWQIHLRIAKGGKEKYGRSYSVLHAAITKYGKENFFYQEIDNTNDEQKALHLEKYWISQLKDSGYTLYNVTDGGEGTSGRKHTEETKYKIGFSQQGSKSYNAKLDENKVIKIKQLLKENKNRKDIANIFNVSKSTIDMIAKNKRWPHII